MPLPAARLLRTAPSNSRARLVSWAVHACCAVDGAGVLERLGSAADRPGVRVSSVGPGLGYRPVALVGEAIGGELRQVAWAFVAGTAAKRADDAAKARGRGERGPEDGRGATTPESASPSGPAVTIRLVFIPAPESRPFGPLLRAIDRGDSDGKLAQVIDSFRFGKP